MSKDKQILITGGTGFIGTYLGERLMRDGHYLTIITRSPDKYNEESSKNQRYISWESDLVSEMEKTDIVINLAGENLFGRWNDTVKKKIYDSRIQATRKIVEAIRKSESKPELLISASGVSIYGDHGDSVIDESTPAADNFLGNVCTDWEAEARKATDYGVRVAVPRFGPVLEDGGGLVEIMRLPFAFFIGGPVGSGHQYIPWIHMQDLCNAVLYPVENKNLSGAYNACSPEPKTMEEFTASFGRVMNRPSFFKVPEFALKLVLGEGAGPALESLRVQPKVLQNSGFEFQFEDLEYALADIF
ncbi:TIGR01777 family oxidoreductase [soil metagenome]